MGRWRICLALAVLLALLGGAACDECDERGERWCEDNKVMECVNGSDNKYDLAFTLEEKQIMDCSQHAPPGRCEEHDSGAGQTGAYCVYTGSP